MSKIIESAKAEAQYTNAPVAKTTNTEKDGIKRRTRDMDKVYVVQNMKMVDETRDTTIERRFGVLLNYEDAKKCLDQNLKELRSLYEKVGNPSRVEVIEKEGDDFKSYMFCYYRKSGDMKCFDLIALCHCELGKWNDGYEL